MSFIGLKLDPRFASTFKDVIENSLNIKLVEPDQAEILISDDVQAIQEQRKKGFWIIHIKLNPRAKPPLKHPYRRLVTINFSNNLARETIKAIKGIERGQIS